MTKDTDKLISFLKSAFNAHEHGRVYNQEGTIGHAEVQIGDSIVLMFDAKPDWPETPAFIFLYVDNCEEYYEQALQAGATSMTKIVTQSWGDRIGRIRDPFGNIWWLTSHVEDVSPEEIIKRSGEKEYIEAMEYAQNSFNPDCTPSSRKQPITNKIHFLEIRFVHYKFSFGVGLWFVF